MRQIVREGIVGGLLGAAAVAAWFFVIDVLFRELFFTPAALGSAFFAGAAGPADIEITFATVLGYTVFHIAAFLLAGLVASLLFNKAEREPTLVLALVLILVSTVAGFIGLVAIAAAWILEAFAWWTLLLGGAIGALVLGMYLWRRHPAVRAELQDPALEERQ